MIVDVHVQAAARTGPSKVRTSGARFCMPCLFGNAGRLRTLKGWKFASGSVKGSEARNTTEVVLQAYQSTNSRSFEI